MHKTEREQGHVQPYRKDEPSLWRDLGQVENQFNSSVLSFSADRKRHSVKKSENTIYL